MRLFVSVFLLSLLFSACKKDKYTSEPQITFISLKPSAGSNITATNNPPLALFEVRDEEGDLDTDSAKIYIKNTFTNQLDSLQFPDLKSVLGKNFKGDVEVNLIGILRGRNPNNVPKPFTDTLGFEIYVVDKAKHKSNVITTSPYYYTFF